MRRTDGGVAPGFGKLGIFLKVRISLGAVPVTLKVIPFEAIGTSPEPSLNFAFQPPGGIIKFVSLSVTNMPVATAEPLLHRLMENLILSPKLSWVPAGKESVPLQLLVENRYR